MSRAQNPRQSKHPKLGLLGLVLALLALNLAMVRLAARADENDRSEIRRASIAQNCGQMRMRLKQLQTNDASVRVALGQNYENMLTKLMDAMNSRLTANRMDSGELPSIAADFNRNLGLFRRNHISYDQKITELNKLDCAKSPDDFYRTLESARNLRNAVRLNYNRLNELIDNYRTELNENVWSVPSGEQE
jgi:hypothetical protein